MKKNLKLLIVIIWAITGVAVFMEREVSLFSFACVWATLMLYVVLDYKDAKQQEDNNLWK